MSPQTFYDKEGIVITDIELKAQKRISVSIDSIDAVEIKMESGQGCATFALLILGLCVIKKAFFVGLCLSAFSIFSLFIIRALEVTVGQKSIKICDGTFWEMRQVKEAIYKAKEHQAKGTQAAEKL